MICQGGKHIAAPHIVAAMIENGASPDTAVIEPFCGGGSVTVALCKAGFHVWASDINPSLEYQAPFGKLVWERETPLGLAAGRNGSGRTQTERLYL